MRGSRRIKALVWGISAMALVFALGAYNKSISGAERGSFVMNYPATGTEAGGPSPRNMTGMVMVPIDNAGFVKKYLQPGVIEVASHVVSNVGDVPRRIRFEVEGFDGTELEWHSRDKAWNPDTHEIEREIPAGEAVDFGLTVTLPEPLPTTEIPVQGTIYIADAETGKRISKLPVYFAHTGATVGGTCCE